MLAVALLPASGAVVAESPYQSAWCSDCERTWISSHTWANRLQDWRIANGRLECLVAKFGLPMRTVHCLTHRLRSGAGDFEVSVDVGVLAPPDDPSPQSAAGFLVGVGGAAMDYRAASTVHGFSGPGAGYFAGVTVDGQVFILDNEADWIFLPIEREEADDVLPVRKHMYLKLKGSLGADGAYTLKLSAYDVEDAAKPVLLSETTAQVAADRLIGNVALVSHPGPTLTKGARRVLGSKNRDNESLQALKTPCRFWFQKWALSGAKVEADTARALGPILSTQYTLSHGVMKLTAQLMPLETNRTHQVALQIQTGNAWETIAKAPVLTPSWTAPFRIANWDATRDTPYRVVYELKRSDGTSQSTHWQGTIRRDPVDKETIVVAGFTGNHNNAGGISAAGRRDKKRRPFDWITGMWFPHADVTAHVAKHNPDLLFFSGDQVYEHLSPTSVDHDHLNLDYLYKWYFWCWAYRDLTREVPAVTIPDDHDVYQSNLWGAGGRKTNVDDKGGYLFPADFVNLVERTQTSHLPDPVDPRPVEQGIGVYFTRMTMGRIGFAILEDRKFKSGCAGRIKAKTRDRADHINDPEFDMRKADEPGLTLLGERQLSFLNQFADDWTGEDMKVVLSQTIFANMATHHGPRLFRLIADLDSNGWPQTGRNRALAELRRCFAVHIAGDQHLATVVHHGIDMHNDAIWSFCVPSVANFYPRAWMPEAEGKNRPAGAPPNMGEHVDGFGNKVTVYAAANPTAMTGVSSGVEPLGLHDKMPGYGIVKLNKTSREITFECWPRYVDPTDPSTGTQYAGWPKTIHQLNNYGAPRAGYLPRLQVAGMTNPVVQVVQESTGEIVYTLRIQGSDFQPFVFEPGTYTVRVGEPGTLKQSVIRGLEIVPEGAEKTLSVVLP